jgi:hypothetical protein
MWVTGHVSYRAIEQQYTQMIGHYCKGARANWEWHDSKVTIRSVRSHNETFHSNSNWAWMERSLVQLMSGSSVRNKGGKQVAVRARIARIFSQLSCTGH